MLARARNIDSARVRKGQKEKGRCEWRFTRSVEWG
jgi:hypothetical protein